MPDDVPNIDSLRQDLRAALLADETASVEMILPLATFPPEARADIEEAAARLVEGAWERRPAGLDALLHEYRLSSQEGVLLMCLAEALLRVPDDATRDRLIRDKLGSADWSRHLGQSDSLLVNASTWALLLTGRVVRPDDGDLPGLWRRLLSRSGEPVIRGAITHAMRILGQQFVMGRTIGEALDRASAAAPYTHSFDMLGEGARTTADAERYLASYADAIAAIGQSGGGCIKGPGISVKLSALHPRYDDAQRERVLRELVPRLVRLCRQAAEENIPLCVDAEEADRLDLSLDVIAATLDVLPSGWDGFGLAVQAYQKRAPLVIRWLVEQARLHGRRLQLRLVKGAYWDTEIKRAQERGLPGYPVYTRKTATDVSYLACARLMAEAGPLLYPQFATHNAQTIAAVAEIMAERDDWEFQRLHGMGEALHDQIVGRRRVRVYAPVGSHEDLLPYLVRRLLENGANTSFVNRLADASVEELVADPAETLAALSVKPHPRLRLPADLYQPERANSQGIDLTDPLSIEPLLEAIAQAASHGHTAAPIIGGRSCQGEAHPVLDPADRRREVGLVSEADSLQVHHAVTLAQAAQPSWNATSATERAAALDRAADLYETDRAELMALAIREAGKTIPDALAEVREAVDLLRYYAARARAEFGPDGIALPGPTGESNRLSLHGRGVFACISPWNFPLAIFTGQVAAALAAGNAVVAKPAEQTPLTAAQAVRLLHRAGIPGDVLHLLPGDGAVGARLVVEPGIAGVAFTGSTEVARGIARALAMRDGAILPLIAETGGQNAMIVDSSALVEQVVGDVLASSFLSAGQRCSALRILFVQDDIATKLLSMLTGAMAELTVGDPGLLSTDIGPVIDFAARTALEDHAARMTTIARPLYACPLPASTAHGSFFAPRLIEIDRAERVDREVFGPILHVVRYAGSQLEGVLDAIAATGYGLTLGVHSRIDATIRRVVERARVGNVYINRSMIGAVVGTQPFGGEGLSGTGPKAGGPHYLHRFAVERSLSVNTAAAGGNAALLSMEGE